MASSARHEKFLTTVIEGIFADRDSENEYSENEYESEAETETETEEESVKKNNLESKLLAMTDKKVTMETCKTISGEEWLQ